jgi:hypothetical protein
LRRPVEYDAEKYDRRVQGGNGDDRRHHRLNAGQYRDEKALFE